MSHFTHISATLINEKYYRGHSQAGKMKTMEMLRMRKMERAACIYLHVCLCVCTFVYVCVIRKQVEGGEGIEACCSGGKNRSPTTLRLVVLLMIIPYVRIS